MALMDAAFPDGEELPVWLLRLLALREDIDFRAYFDGDDFVGFTFVTATERLAFLLYLAVNSQLRSKGYGSQMLDMVRRAYEGRDLALDMERVDERAANYEQRVRRRAFYERNGFHETGLLMEDGDDAYSILANTPFLDVDECERALGRLSFGLVRPGLVHERQLSDAVR